MDVVVPRDMIYGGKSHCKQTQLSVETHTHKCRQRWRASHCLGFSSRRSACKLSVPAQKALCRLVLLNLFLSLAHVVLLICFIYRPRSANVMGRNSILYMFYRKSIFFLYSKEENNILGLMIVIWSIIQLILVSCLCFCPYLSLLVPCKWGFRILISCLGQCANK